MRLATNHLGYAVERFDGPTIGWFAITDPYSLREWAETALHLIERTPGAEYRVYPAISQKGE
ncbi:hypothetical protein HF313_15015 [Massilia atriviolacea]|uniref:Uncharacterized protein n=1 Tax=Massilia atriviolacea TaxID=2495579 RepID=A0A430HR86_9BURK|nr:hypothetical protein [Massilia atriviolacea]RSZ60023.1 hypothetical protein EJB06_07540 [Massilia atriviolacea]